MELRDEQDGLSRRVDASNYRRVAGLTNFIFRGCEGRPAMSLFEHGPMRNRARGIGEKRGGGMDIRWTEGEEEKRTARSAAIVSAGVNVLSGS